MNGQPPSSVPPIQPAPPYYPPPRQGIGCFAKGCLTILILGFLFMAIVVGGGWYLYKKSLANLTSVVPADVRLETPTEAQIQAAEKSRDRMDLAIARNEEATVEFTGPELNALLSSDPDLSFLRNHTRIDISNSIMTVTLSAPLDSLPWPGLEGRWFNGTMRLSISYSSGSFHTEIKSAEANGHELPDYFLGGFNSSFDQSFNRSFREEIEKNENGPEFWSRVKSLSLEGDKLVIVTKAR
ncbi:MAG: hypothetical protein WAO00_14545 [Chthoniobacterales bacterium]